MTVKILYIGSSSKEKLHTESDIYKLMLFLYNNVLVCSINIKTTLKTLQHVSVSIQIILGELVVSSLKSLSLKLPKI